MSKKMMIRLGVCVALLGTIANFGNYLWLIGIAQKPEGDLMAARWIYAGCSYFVAAFLLTVPND